MRLLPRGTLLLATVPLLADGVKGAVVDKELFGRRDSANDFQGKRVLTQSMCWLPSQLTIGARRDAGIVVDIPRDPCENLYLAKAYTFWNLQTSHNS